MIVQDGESRTIVRQNEGQKQKFFVRHCRRLKTMRGCDKRVLEKIRGRLLLHKEEGDEKKLQNRTQSSEVDGEL